MVNTVNLSAKRSGETYGTLPSLSVGLLNRM